MGKNFQDRDYLQDIQGDIYQVIGSLHTEEGIFALQKYKKISSNLSKTSHQSHQSHQSQIPTSDPIGQIKNHEFMYWKQKGTNELFIRILPNYSSQSAKKNIENNHYKKFSPIFQIPMIIIPLDKIIHHWKPQQRFKELLSMLCSKNFDEKNKLDKLEREAIEVGVTIENTFKINISNIGITGSLLWQAQHEHSDIDLMIYGTEFLKIVNSGEHLLSTLRGLRGFKNIEIFPLAEKMAIKTGLSMEECFEYILKKNYLFFFNNRKVSITFAPNPAELIKYPLFLPESQFISIKPVTIQAKIESSEWGYYYPGLFEISCRSILGDDKFNPHEISRLIVYEHELVGYYREGDIVEIRGLLQKCINIPNFNDLEPISTLQILVGGNETIGNEYVRIIK